jgi:hypothetical protein
LAVMATKIGTTAIGSTMKKIAGSVMRKLSTL